MDKGRSVTQEDTKRSVKLRHKHTHCSRSLTVVGAGGGGGAYDGRSAQKKKDKTERNKFI